MCQCYQLFIHELKLQKKLKLSWYPSLVYFRLKLQKLLKCVNTTNFLKKSQPQLQTK